MMSFWGLALLVLGGVTLLAYGILMGVAIASRVDHEIALIAIGNSISLLLLAIAGLNNPREAQSLQASPSSGNEETAIAAIAPPDPTPPEYPENSAHSHALGRSAQISDRALIRERQQQAIFSCALDAMAIADDRGDYVEVNPAACELFGLSLDRLLGKRIADFMETQFDFDLAWRDFLQSGQQIGELSLLRADGTVRVVEYAAKAHIVPGRHLSVLRDVTERYQAQQALRESQNFLQHIADTIPNHLYIYDLTENRHIYTNRQMQHFFGCTDAEIQEKGSQFLLESLHPEDRQKLPVFWDRFTVAAPGEIFTHELRYKNECGEWRWFRTWEIVFSRTAAGLPEKILGTAIDVTDRRQIESALRKSEELYRTVTKHFPNGAVILFDRDLRYTLAEGQGLAVVGLSKELLEGKTIWEVFSVAECERLEPIYRAAFAGETTAFEMPYGNRIYWVQVLPVKNDRGEIRAGMVITHDISDRHYAQRALIDERNFVSAVLDTAGALVVVLDTDGRILRFNRACERITGYSFAEVKGCYIWDLFLIPEEVESVKAVFRELQEGQLPYERENYWVGRDGKRHAIAWSNTVLFDTEGAVKYTIATGIDITYRKREEEIRRALEREQELSQLQIQFFSRVAHEFRTPLSTILMSAQILHARNQELEPSKNFRNLYRIQASVKQMLRLLDNITIVNRAETGKLEFNPTLVAVEAFCRGVVEEMQGYGGQDVAIAFFENSGGNPKKFALVDEKLLRGILGNLLSNAIKYSSSGTTVNLSLEWEDDTAIFQVSDRGRGIVPEDRPHLFEPFFRGQNVGTIPGSGLGLTVVKKCVELHGGAIAVESRRKGGTTFTVTLPLWCDLG